MDLLMNPELADRILEIPFRYHLTAAEKLASMGVDMIWTGDDIGSQKGMLFHPDTWRRFLKPRMAELVGGSRPSTPTCSWPITPTATFARSSPSSSRSASTCSTRCSRPAWTRPSSSATTAMQLLFWGSIDEQKTLPFGTPDDVRAEIELRLETIGAGGGLILGPTHHVQLDTPLENFWAMIETIRETPG